VCQALTFAALGRAEDAIQTLRVIIEQDVPDHVRRRDEVFQEVVSLSFLFHFYQSDLHSNIIHLQNALQHFSYWTAANLLTLNYSKT